jgi:hypothetical protein
MFFFFLQQLLCPLQVGCLIDTEREREREKERDAEWDDVGTIPHWEFKLSKLFLIHSYYLILPSIPPKCP